jgi:nitrate reductase NapE component
MDSEHSAGLRAAPASKEAKWFWRGVAWGVLTTALAGAFGYLKWRSDLRIRSGPYDTPGIEDAVAGSIISSLLGIPLCLFCGLMFLGSWTRWLIEIKERRGGSRK